MKTFLEEIRLPDEKKTLDYLEEVLNVSTINDLLAFHANQKKDRSLSKKMQFNLPLSPQVGGNLYALTQEILHLLNYTDRQVAFYISNDIGFNATTYFNRNEDEPHYIVFNSGLLEKHTEKEMRFVIGHELGHLIYKHADFNYVVEYIHYSGFPNFIKKIHQLWSNLSEMSADRVGSLAVDAFDTAVSAMFKMSSGLDMESLQVNAKHFIAMNDKLVADMTTSRQNYLTETHPANSLRIKALDVFYHCRLRKSFLKSRKLVQDHKLHRQTDELIALLKDQPEDDIEQAGLDFLTAAGYYLINGDGDVAAEEYDEFMNMLSVFHSWPPDYVKQLLKKSKMMTIINKSASIIIEKCPQYVPSLFRTLVPLITMDKRIKTDGIEALLLIAGKLKLPKLDAIEIILEKIRGKYQPIV
ncbi:MAG: metalloendopeptidase family M48 [Syntrophaceae bacterium]|nr:MAG: metalloendopeptidase family M48 [Syntrophaceae bacterium]